MHIWERMKLNGRCAIVTGAARNLGKSYAEGLAMAGASVCIADIRKDSAAQAAEEIRRNYGVAACSYEVDVTEPEQVQALVSYTAQTLGSVDICVANAGIFIESPAEMTSPELWSQILAVNLTGAWYTCQFAARFMIANQICGSIIATTSISAHQASKAPGCAYSASKGGLLSLVHDMAAEWGKYGIRVNCISPGNMNTAMLSPKWRETYMAACEEKTVLGRLGEPEELQGALVYLAGDGAGYTTGAEIIVDGGYTIK